MKKTNGIYWTATILFSLMMLFSAVPNILLTPEAIDLIHTRLGYPEYFITLIGWAKLLGVIAILIPGYPRVKEWAYAGLLFDLVAALLSAMMAEGFDPQQLGMFIFIIPGVVSYLYYHKRLQVSA